MATFVWHISSLTHSKADVPGHLPEFTIAQLHSQAPDWLWYAMTIFFDMVDRDCPTGIAAQVSLAVWSTALRRCALQAREYAEFAWQW